MSAMNPASHDEYVNAVYKLLENTPGVTGLQRNVKVPHTELDITYRFDGARHIIEIKRSRRDNTHQRKKQISGYRRLYGVMPDTYILMWFNCTAGAEVYQVNGHRTYQLLVNSLLEQFR